VGNKDWGRVQSLKTDVTGSLTQPPATVRKMVQLQNNMADNLTRKVRGQFVPAA